MAGRQSGIEDARYAALESAAQFSHPLLRRLHADWVAAISRLPYGG
jgi:hypothetical protein